MSPCRWLLIVSVYYFIEGSWGAVLPGHGDGGKLLYQPLFKEGDVITNLAITINIGDSSPTSKLRVAAPSPQSQSETTMGSITEIEPSLWSYNPHHNSETYKFGTAGDLYYDYQILGERGREYQNSDTMFIQDIGELIAKELKENVANAIIQRQDRVSRSYRPYSIDGYRIISLDDPRTASKEFQEGKDYWRNEQQYNTKNVDRSGQSEGLGNIFQAVTVQIIPDIPIFVDEDDISDLEIGGSENLYNYYEVDTFAELCHDDPLRDATHFSMGGLVEDIDENRNVDNLQDYLETGQTEMSDNDKHWTFIPDYVVQIPDYEDKQQHIEQHDRTKNDSKYDEIVTFGEQWFAALHQLYKELIENGYYIPNNVTKSTHPGGSEVLSTVAKPSNLASEDSENEFRNSEDRFEDDCSHNYDVPKAVIQKYSEKKLQENGDYVPNEQPNRMKNVSKSSVVDLKDSEQEPPERDDGTQGKSTSDDRLGGFMPALISQDSVKRFHEHDVNSHSKLERIKNIRIQNNSDANGESDSRLVTASISHPEFYEGSGSNINEDQNTNGDVNNSESNSSETITRMHLLSKKGHTQVIDYQLVEKKKYLVNNEIESSEEDDSNYL